MFRTQLIRAETKVLDLKAGRVEAVVSTEARDRAGDIIRQSGWDLVNFLKHPVLVSSHNYIDLRAQIGEWESLQVVGKKLVGTARYYVGEGNEQADWGFNLASKGRAAFSVGFKPDLSKAVELESSERDSPFRTNYEFKGQELLEVSQVVIPANAQALQSLHTLSLDPAIAGIVDETLRDMPPGKVPDIEALVASISERVFDALPLLLDVMGRPYPNEHACRLREPGDFKPDSFRRTEREHEGKKYSVIMGRLKGEDTMTEQAYRYPKGTWAAGEARSHCKSHDGAFEAVSEEAILTLKAWTEAMADHMEDCPECQELVREHMREGKGLNLSGAVRTAIEQTLKEVIHAS